MNILSPFEIIICKRRQVLTCLLLIILFEPTFAQAPGLYKDGQKIVDFDDIISMDSPFGGKPYHDRSTKGTAFYKGVVGDDFRPDNLIYKVYLDNISKCRELAAIVDTIGNVDSIYDLVAKISSINKILEQNSKAILIYYEQITNIITTQKYSQAKLERQNHAYTQHKLFSDSLKSFLDDIEEAHKKDDINSIRNNAKLIIELLNPERFQNQKPALSNNQSPSVIKLEEAPTYTRSEAKSLSRALEQDQKNRLPDPGDLDSTTDIKFTEDIISLAADLNNSAAEIYHYVHDYIEFEPYLGSRKGAQQTLSHKAGNDYDQASLLIALLRTSGIPARYATGYVEMSLDQVKNWIGVDNYYMAANILYTVGMEGYINSGLPAVGCRRVWVEAYLPMNNYRGAVNDSTGFMWISLDPAYKQYSNQIVINFPDEIGFNGEDFVEDYYSSFHEETPLEIFRQMLTDSLNLYYPELELNDLYRTREIISENDGILPGTLPYTVVVQDNVYTEIPDNKRYKIRFHLHGMGTNLDYTMNVPEIVEKQLTISYIGATPEDQNIIDTSGGGFNVDVPYLVDLVPVIKLDGCIISQGTGSVLMGDVHYSDMHFIAPIGVANYMPAVYNTIVAGNTQGIGIDTEDALPNIFGIQETECEDSYLAQELYQTSLTYLNRVNLDGDEIAGLMHIILINDVAEALVENSINVSYNGYGYPVSFEWTGMAIDADRKVLGPFSRDGIDNWCDFMRLEGANGSIHENRIFEDRFEEEGISAVKVLEIASDSGIAICNITSSINECPNLNQSQLVINSINSALASGRHVIIPEQPITYFDWTGTGWIEIDPYDCGAAYMLQGENTYAGGQTVKIWEIDYGENVYCRSPVGPMTVEPLDDNNYYDALDTRKWNFIVPEIHYYQWFFGQTCVLTQSSYDVEIEIPLSINTIADQYGPGDYQFEVGSMTDNCDNCGTISTVVTIIKTTLEEVVFTSDHGVLRNYNTDFEGDGSPADVFNPRGWKAGMIGSNPITHTRNQNTEIAVRAKVEPANINYTLAGSSPNLYANFEPIQVTSSGQTQLIFFESQGLLPDNVNILYPSIIWKFSVEGKAYGEAKRLNQQIYVTWGTPSVHDGSHATIKRIHWLCEEASTNSSKELVADALWKAVNQHTHFGSGGTQEGCCEGSYIGWKLRDQGTGCNYCGDCDNLATLMKYAADMIGIGPAQVTPVYASTNAGAGNCLSLESEPYESTNKYLIMNFNIGALDHGNWFWNVWEGCCEVAGSFYAIAPFLKATDDYDMLTKLTMEQWWIITNRDVVPGEEGWNPADDPDFQIFPLDEEVEVP